MTAQAESSENERRALAEARTLSAQMDASWDYIDSIQERINYTHGVFDFKDVYCSVAGKAIAGPFHRQNGLFDPLRAREPAQRHGCS